MRYALLAAVTTVAAVSALAQPATKPLASRPAATTKVPTTADATAPAAAQPANPAAATKIPTAADAAAAPAAAQPANPAAAATKIPTAADAAARTDVKLPATTTPGTSDGPGAFAPTPADTPKLAPNEKLVPVDWEAVRNAKGLERVKFRDMKVAESAGQPKLPILLPFGPETVAASVYVFPEPYSYSASMRLKGLGIEVHGERRAYFFDEKDPATRRVKPFGTVAIAGASVPFTLEETEGGVDLAFNRFGTAYLISIECHDPDADPACTKPDFIRTLAEHMSFVGGSP